MNNNLEVGPHTVYKTCTLNFSAAVGHACGILPNCSQEAPIPDKVSTAAVRQAYMGVRENLSILPVCHLATTRLPSIPERSTRGQRLELPAEEEPLPPCKYIQYARKNFEVCHGKNAV